MYRDETCIKSDVCDMAVCDGAECNHRASTGGSADTSTNSAMLEIASLLLEVSCRLDCDWGMTQLELESRCRKLVRQLQQ
jgi:hypothetical protein